MTRPGASRAAASATRPGRPGRRAGIVLLEVVLSLALFSVGALAVLAGLNASLRTAQRVRLEAEAADLAVTLLSELQMGLVPLTDDGPNEYEEDEQLVDWRWEIATEAFEEEVTEPALPEFFRVDIIIRHVPSGYSYRLTQLMTEEDPGGASESAEPGRAGAGGPGQ